MSLFINQIIREHEGIAFYNGSVNAWLHDSNKEMKENLLLYDLLEIRKKIFKYMAAISKMCLLVN